MKYLLAAFCMFVSYLNGIRSEYTFLHWNDCGSDPSIRIHELGVSPMPMLVPGNMSFTMRVSTPNHHLERMKLRLSSVRKSWIDIPLPCVFNVGSCTYDDTCTLLETMQRENWAGVMRDIGSQIQAMLASSGITQTCNTQIEQINIQNYVLKMPSLPSILLFLAEGDYETRLQAIDYRTNHVLVCVDLRMTMKLRNTCTGWFCRMRRTLSGEH